MFFKRPSVGSFVFFQKKVPKVNKKSDFYDMRRKIRFLRIKLAALPKKLAALPKKLAALPNKACGFTQKNSARAYCRV